MATFVKFSEAIREPVSRALKTKLEQVLAVLESGRVSQGIGELRVLITSFKVVRPKGKR